MYKYVITSGGVRLAFVDADSDKEFKEVLRKGEVMGFLPVLIQVWTNNPFSTYGNLKDIPDAPLRKVVF